MPPMVFEPTTPTGERSQTYALDRAVTGTGMIIVVGVIYSLAMNVTDDGHNINIYY